MNATPNTHPADVIIDVEYHQICHDIGCDASYELVRTPGFPASIIPGKTWKGTLEGLRQYELAVQLAGCPGDGPGARIRPELTMSMPTSPPTAKRGPKSKAAAR